MNRFFFITMLGIVILTMFLFHDKAIIFPILYGILLFTLTIDFISNRLKIKSGRHIKIGKNKSEIWTSVIVFTIGIIMIIIGLLFKSSWNWNGFDSKFFWGLLFVTTSIFRYDDSLIIIKEKTIQFNEFLNKSEWKISKIEKAEIDKNNVRFEQKEKTIELTIEESEISTLTQILTKKMNDRLTIK